MADGEERKEVSLNGVTVEIGEKFCFPDFKYLDQTEAKNASYMIGEIGSGPFVLLKVVYYPRDGFSSYMLHFIDDNRNEVSITSEYFVKYNEKESEKIEPCEEGCVMCGEDNEQYQKLISCLSAVHVASSRVPAELCSASFREFDKNHPDFSRYSRMQGELFEMASRHKLSWSLK